MTKDDAIKASEAIQNFKDNRIYIEELSRYLAEERMIKYKAHIDAGFSPEQALYLIR